METISQHIEINAGIMIGKPIIKGTRISVESIVDELAAGYTMQQVLAAHPNLKEEHILAALQYASAIIINEKIYTAAS